MLNLPNWEVEKINQTEFDFQVTARYVLPLPHCPGCHHTSLVGFGTRHQLFMDFPQQGKRVGVAVVRRRYKCKSCGKVSLQPLPDMDDSHAATKRLIEYIKKEAVRRTFLALADEVGLHEKTIRRIFAEYVRQLEHTIKFATPKWMGLDEIHVIWNRNQKKTTRVRREIVKPFLNQTELQAECIKSQPTPQRPKPFFKIHGKSKKLVK